MKLYKPAYKFIGLAFASWSFLNIAFNMIGLFVNKIITGTEYVYLDNILLEFVKPMAIQSLVFLFCLTVASVFVKKKMWSSFAFVVVQAVAFHILFVLNLQFTQGIQFATTVDSFAIQYLGNFGQYLIDVLYLYFPINGNFSNGQFIPTNVAVFYFYWIFLSLAYYVGITWLMLKWLKFFFDMDTH